MDDKKRYGLLGALALKYRLSLENVCMLEGIPITKENKNMIYDKLITSNFDLERAFRFLFTVDSLGISPNPKADADKVRLAKLGYETKGEAAFKRLQAKKYLDYLKLNQELSKIPSDQQDNDDVRKLKNKLNSLKSSISPLDSEERQYKFALELYKMDQQIREKAGKPKRNLTPKEIMTISRYRLKFAVSCESVAEDFSINQHTVSILESDIQDEVLKARLKNLNNYLFDRYVTRGGKLNK